MGRGASRGARKGIGNQRKPETIPTQNGGTMNTETGQIYRGVEEIEAARERGEPVVEVSNRVAKLMERAQSQPKRRRPSHRPKKKGSR